MIIKKTSSKKSLLSPYLFIILIFFVIALVFVGKMIVVGQKSTESQTCKTSLIKASKELWGLSIGEDAIQCNAKIITFTNDKIKTELMTSTGRYITDEEPISRTNLFLAREINSCFEMAGIELNYCKHDKCILKCAHLRNNANKEIKLDSDLSDNSFFGYKINIGNEKPETFVSNLEQNNEYILGVESFKKEKRIILLPIQDILSGEYKILN